MPRRDGNKSGARRRSGRNHAPMNSARKGRQHSPKYTRRMRAEQAREDQARAAKKARRAVKQQQAATSTLAGRELAPDVALGRRVYMRI